jgi:TolB-like protein
MIYRFEEFSFDTRRCELRRRERLIPVEPQVYELIRLLIENRDRLVTREEIVDQVWKGRFISDAAISSRIRSVRKALGDDGRTQRLIRTLPRLGFRFAGETETSLAASVTSAEPQAPAIESAGERPSIAILPFAVEHQNSPALAHLADALPQDLISQLSRLRWLFVIARGSSFRFRGEGAEPAKVRAALNVRYVLSGMVEMAGGRIALTVELTDARDGGVVWGDRFSDRIDAVHEIREQIVQAVTAALELQIPLHEARLARLSAPENLDAWQSYHLGLSHLYRFDRDGNARAAALFRQAIAREPGFARAYAGLSFARFEDAFLNFTPDAKAAAGEALSLAEYSLELDDLDPFCNLVMGRAYWLTGDLDTMLGWLERANALHPNYAQARYARAFSQTMMGDARNGRAGADYALALSPLDPLAYAMRSVRAFSHIVFDEPASAVRWAEQAARSPGSHGLIDWIAAVAHALNGDQDRATSWAASARRRTPGLTADDFFTAYPMRQPEARRRIASALKGL